MPDLAGQKSPAGQRFAGGVFALSFCDIGEALGLLYCLIVSALFALRFFCLVFNNWRLWSVSIRCYFRLRIRYPALSPTRSPALSPALPGARCPTSASGRYGRIPIFWCKSARLHTRTWSAYTSWTTLSLPIIHSPVLRGNISALKTSATPAHHCGASAASAGCRSTLNCHVPASIAPAIRA